MESPQRPDAIGIGCWVRINDPDLGEETIHLVDHAEERPEKGRYSDASPFARALIGAKQGQRVTYSVPHAGIEEEEIQVLDFGLDG